MRNGVNKMNIESRLKQGSPSKFKKDLKELVAIAGVTAVLALGTTGVFAWQKYETDQKIEEYSSLPTITAYLKPGYGIDQMTNKFVDSDKHTIFIRRKVLEQDNPEYAKDPNFQGPFKVHVDYDYCKNKE